MNINKTRYLGIRKTGNRRTAWSARLRHGYKELFLGHFYKLSDAIKAVDDKILEIKGPDANTNAKMINGGLLLPPTDKFDLPEPSIDSLPNEEWKSVVDFVGLYKVSNMGRIISCRIQKNGQYFEILMTPCLSEAGKNGYLRVLLRKDGKSYTRKVHRLVAQAFLENPLNLPQVNHKNLNKLDNRIENLEWVTKLQDVQHSKNAGVFVGRLVQSKLNSDQVKEIRELYKSGNYSLNKLSKKYNVTKSCICDILKRRTWKHLD